LFRWPKREVAIAIEILILIPQPRVPKDRKEGHSTPILQKKRIEADISTRNPSIMQSLNYRRASVEALLDLLCACGGTINLLAIVGPEDRKPSTRVINATPQNGLYTRHSLER
jgi:hypothetical protein